MGMEHNGRMEHNLDNQRLKQKKITQSKLRDSLNNDGWETGFEPATS